MDTETLWENCRLPLKHFILRRVEDEAAAEDLLQEVFLRIHTRMDTLKDSQRLESWIYQIARNAIIDHYRARRPAFEIPETLPGDAAPTPEPDPETELAGSIRELVESLPEPYRQALLLAEFEGLSQQEVAERMGISLPGAKSRIQRGRQKIKDALLTCCHFEFDHYGRVIDYWENCCCCASK